MAFNQIGLSDRVDLTENRDFGGNAIVRNEILFNIIVGDPYDYEALSFDDYQKLELREKFFGKREHISSRGKAFNYREKYLIGEREKCYNCGAKMLIPWKFKMHLCPKCYGGFEGNQIPWHYSTPSNLNDSREILRMK